MILPQIMPGVATGAVFAFIVSWDEIVVTLFIASRAVYTLPRKMWDGINEQVDPTIAAAATVLFLVTLVAIGWQIAGRPGAAPRRHVRKPEGGMAGLGLPFVCCRDPVWYRDRAGRRGPARPQVHRGRGRAWRLAGL